MANDNYTWTDNPTVSGVSICDTDVLNDCLMHLKYDKKDGGNLPLFTAMIFDHVLSGDEAVGWALQGSAVTSVYPEALAKIKQLFEDGADTVYREVECKRSVDGRYIADISQKDKVDELFALTGVADFYVLDSVNNCFYLPKNKRFYQFTDDTSAVNEYKEAGLPNITGEISVGTDGTSYDGVFGQKYYSNRNYAAGANSGKGLTFDASASNPIYGNSDTVQPISSLKLLYYKVGDVIVNESEIDVSNVLSELNLLEAQKADISLSNLLPNATMFIAHQTMPSDKYDELSIPVSEDTATAPADGYFLANWMASTGNQYMSLKNSLSEFCSTDHSFANLNTIRTWIPVKKGDTIKIGYSVGTFNNFRFYYAQGASND